MEILASMLLIACSLAYMSLAKGDSVLVDVESLLDFKRSISHDPSHVLGNWNVSHNNSHCNWTGITCSLKHPGRVVSLNITQSSLQGTISPHIGNLSFLHYLNLSSNAFTGAIPPTIGELGKLRVIGLSDNNLSGNIPKYIGSLTQLFVLDVANNSLTGNVEKSIQNLSSLRTLRLSYNQFRGMVPSWVGLLSKLEQFYLHNNNLSGNIPESLANCSSLEIISLYNNDLYGTIPSSLGMLGNMKELYLYNNHLSGGIPSSLSNATNLRIMDLSMNALQGTIPVSFGQLSSLQFFSASDNHIESGVSNTSYEPIPILQALSNCSKLYFLGLSRNKIGGHLPSEFPKQLETFYLSDCQVSGNIPPSIGNLSKLTTLCLFGNYLRGSIPPTIGRLKSLQGLFLANNMLHGSIPEEMCSLSNLYEVNISINHLTGSIPRNIGQLTNLRRLYLNKNSFTGGIPEELGECELLEDLILSSNNLSGKIPRGVANLKNINFFFDLSNNKLSGTLPPEIRGMQMALHIDLSNNKLSGKIGLHMDAWLNAEYINMSFNKFSGNLSESFGAKQSGLRVVDLSHNNFSGKVPSSLYKHSGFQILNFSYNNLEGRIYCAGAFKVLKHSSFLHNQLLCGKCMGLPECVEIPTQHSNRHFYKAIWFIIIVVIIGFSCVIASWYLLLFKKKKQELSDKEEAASSLFRAITKEELVTATKNFSEANLIGKGSFGAVYSGVLRSREAVAVKIFKAVNQQRSNASFIRECQTLGKVRHRNLTKIITVCCEGNFKAIVLPLMVKGNLHDFLHERDMEGILTPISLEVRMNIISELASALSYLHHECTPSIVHCDVKPENVLLDHDMTVKLTDFGIAKIIGAPLESTTLSIRGTVGYVAPEYGVGGDVTSRGDVYSFGVVVLEVMTRRKPTDEFFSGDISMLEWVYAALTEKDHNKKKLRSIVEIPNFNEEDLKKIEWVMKLGIVCCNEDPYQRPTMREVENLLFNFGQKGKMPSLEDILASLHTNQAQPPTECSSSGTF